MANSSVCIVLTKITFVLTEMAYMYKVNPGGVYACRGLIQPQKHRLSVQNFVSLLWRKQWMESG